MQAIVTCILIVFSSPATMTKKHGVSTGIGRHSVDDKMTGGTPVTDLRDYAYMVTIQRHREPPQSIIHKCGGSIVTRMLVLTAAHCLADINSCGDIVLWDVSRLRFVAGTLHQRPLDSTAQIRNASAFYVDPKFSNASSFIVHDVGVAKMTEQWILNDYVALGWIPARGITAYRREVERIVRLNPDCTMAGWGGDNTSMANDLTTAIVKFVPDLTCRNRIAQFFPRYANYSFRENDQFCMRGTTKDFQTWTGDSGNPVVCEYFKILGVLSYKILKLPIIQEEITILPWLCQLAGPDCSQILLTKPPSHAKSGIAVTNLTSMIAHISMTIAILATSS